LDYLEVDIPLTHKHHFPAVDGFHPETVHCLDEGCNEMIIYIPKVKKE